MFKQKFPLPVIKALKPILMASIVVAGIAALAVMLPIRTQKLSAATSSTINFQARLLTAAGNVVPDGDYHVEFKLYSAAAADGGETPNQGACTTNPGGVSDEDCLWTETRTTGNLVRVVNGYLTVNLGSVTAFPGTVDWDQELWMSMRIGGSAGSAAWETTEMTPRLKLTAVPYAFRAGTLMGGTGANTTKLTTGTPSGNNTISLPAETGVVCLQSSTNCGFISGSTASFIQNQNSAQQASSNFWISGTGRADTSFSTTLLTTVSGDLNIDPTGDTVIKGSVATNASAALTIQNSASTSILFARNDGNVGIGTASPSSRLHVSTGTSGAANVRIEADTDNNNEADQPSLTFAADGGTTLGQLGFFDSLNDLTLYSGSDDLRLGAGGRKQDIYILGSNGNVGIGTGATINARLEVNSGTSGASGVRLTQLTSASSSSSSYSGLLAVDSSGNIGISPLTAPLTNQALAYWDGINNPTTGSQAYPLATISGNAAFDSGNGVKLTPNTNNQYGSLGWQFTQQEFMRIQFKMKAGGGTGADGIWFYSYADAVPTTEYAGGGSFSEGYIVYFSEYHDCAGITYGPFWDGEQCNDGGANQPLLSVSKTGLDDNNWHDVDISILQNKIIVRYDGTVLMSYDDVYTRDTTGRYFGFGARTGGANNNHWIKGLAVTKLGTNVSEYQIADVTAIQSAMYWDRVNGRLGLGIVTPGSRLTVKGTTTDNTASSLNVTNSSDASLLFVRNDGYVGIGTASPNNHLVIYDGSDAVYAFLQGTGDTYNYSGLVLASDEATDKNWGILHTKSPTANRFMIQEYDGSVYNGRFVIEPGGNVGINDGDPDYRFDVSGDINSTTGYRINGTAGASTTCSGGQFLQNQVVAGGIVTGGSCASAGGGSYVTLQGSTPGTPDTGNLNISGTGIFGTSVLTPLIGTASGDLNIDPTGNTIIKGSVATNASAALHVQNSAPTTLLFVRNDGNVGVGTASPGSRLSVMQSMTDTSGFLAMQYNELTAAPGAASSATFIASRNTATTSNGLTYSISGTLAGMYNEVTHDGAAASTVSAAYGLQSNLKLTGAGTISQGAGAVFSAQINAGTLTSGFGVIAQNPTGAGTVQNFAGIAIDAITKGTNKTGLLIGTTSIPSGNWGIYNSSSNDNYLAGNTGIGVISPYQRLHVGSGNILLDNTYYLMQRNASGTQREVLGMDSSNQLRLKSQDGVLWVNPDTGTDTSINYNQNGDVDIVAGTSTGRLGVGTNGPSYKLDVQGGDINTSGVYRSGGTAGVARTCGAGQYLQSQTTVGGIVTGGTCTSVSGGGSFVNLQASTPGTQQTGHLNISGTGRFDTSVVVPLITTTTLTDLTINPTLNTIIIGSSTSSLYGALDVQNSATTSLLFVENDGKVGINDSSPTYDLDVTGDINASGVYRSGGTAGVSRTCSGGQYLLNQTTAGGIVTGGTCTAAPGSNFVTLQASTPGTPDTGHFNISGTGIAGTSLQAPILKTADRTSSGTSTALEVLSGNGTVPGANSGTLTLHSGDSTTSGNTGNTTLKSGDASLGTSGTLTLSSGAAGGSTGAVTLNSGHASNPSSASGNMNIYTGNSTTSGDTGYISMRTGAASSGSTGAVTIYSGLASAMSSTSGAISLYSGNTDAPSSNTGAVSLISGNSTSTGDTGTGTFRTGNATSGSSGTITINSGTAGGSTATSGNVNIYTGANTATISGNTGSLSLYTGNSSNSNSGSLSLDVGSAGGTAGSINIGTTRAPAAINIGPTGSAAVTSTVNVGTSTGATQTVRLGSTGTGNAAAGTTINIQGGTTANTAVVLGTNGAGGITIDTGTTGAILIGAGTSNNAKTITIGPTATKTSTTTIQIGVNTAGTETIQIGSAGTGDAANGTTVNIQGGTTANTAVVIGTKGAGGITIDTGTTGGISIGYATSAKAVAVGSPIAGSTTTLYGSGGSMALDASGNINITGASNAVVTVGNTGLGGLGVNLIGPNYTTSTRGVSVGTSDGNITLLNLDVSTQTTAETAGNCSTTINPGGIYYSAATTTNNTTTHGIRGCINGSWIDIVAADQLGILLFGVVEDSGSNPGDVGGITGAANGPCKVAWASTTSVTVAPCVAYSAGRKVVVASTRTVSSLNGNTLFYHICLNGTNGSPVATTGNASQMAAVPTFSSTAPVLCLATVKTGASSTITNIYDTRTFVSSTKQFTTFTSGSQTGVAPGMIVIMDSTNGPNRITTTTTAQTAVVRGVVAVGSTSNSTSTVNSIITTSGVAYVLGSGGATTIGNTAKTSTTLGVADDFTIGGGYTDLGPIIGVGTSSACNASTNCQFSYFVDVKAH